MTLSSSSEANASSPASAVCRLSVIIPVYNEKTTLPHVIAQVEAHPLTQEIIIVDDGSTDGTREWLRQLVSERSASRGVPVKVVFQPKNVGKGAAIREGIQHATARITLIQDADLEYNPKDFERLIEPIVSGEADVVYGSRFRGDRVRVHMFWHSLGNKLLTLFSNLCTNLTLTDMETGYKVFTTDILRQIPLRSNRFGFEPEITAKIAKLRCRIFEVPVSYRGRGYDEGKKIGWKDGVAALWTIFRFWLVDDLVAETAGLRTLRIMEGAGEYNRWLFAQCQPFLGRRILEMGSGVGNITKFLLPYDATVATDVSDHYLAELATRFQSYPQVSVAKLDMTDTQQALSLSKTHQPDTVLSMNVLEHIENDALALKNIFSLLPSGGSLVLLVPSHQALYSDLDRNIDHFRRYERESLVSELKKSGFTITHVRSLNLLGALGWWFNGKVLRRKLLPSRQLRLFDIVVKFLDLERHFKLRFGLSLLVVARKPEGS